MFVCHAKLPCVASSTTGKGFQFSFLWVYWSFQLRGHEFCQHVSDAFHQVRSSQQFSRPTAQLHLLIRSGRFQGPFSEVGQRDSAVVMGDHMKQRARKSPVGLVPVAIKEIFFRSRHIPAVAVVLKPCSTINSVITGNFRGRVGHCGTQVSPLRKAQSCQPPEHNVIEARVSMRLGTI